MYLDFYHLCEDPFGVTPDPIYLYPTRTHCQALDSLTEGIQEGRGFLALIAEPGMGKTTLLNQVLDALRDTARTAFLFQTQCNSREFFQYLLSELGVDSSGMGLVALHNKLNRILFDEMLAGRRFVLIVDEAQNLDDSVLETIRLLSNFETSNTKLLQIILAGQPQLGEKLEQRHLTQLRQRIAIVTRLEALSPEETAGYIRHRLKVAGHRDESLFEPEALTLVGARSQGIPRSINKICYGALMEAYLEGRHTISAEMIERSERRSAVQISRTPAPKLPSESVAAIPEQSLSAKETQRLTYRPLTGNSFPKWPKWAAAVITVLVVAGLFVPTHLLTEMLQTARECVSAATGLVRRKQADDINQTRNAADPAKHGEAVDFTLDTRSTSTGIASHASSLTYNERNGPMGTVVVEESNVDSHDGPLNSFVSDKTTSSASNDGAAYVRQPSLARELGLKINRIAIDPGHGGVDTGTAGPHGLLEKDLCLDVALRLGRLIEENLVGTDVVYTRDDDRFVSLKERTAIANRAKADLFISIHANSSSVREARGAETYFLNLTASRNSEQLATRENAFAQYPFRDLNEIISQITSNGKVAESKLLASDIQNALSYRLETASQHEKDRGVKQAPFIVLTGAHMPAVLSEISFVSNKSDERLLLESQQRQRVAEGLYQGIAAYLEGLHSLPRNQKPLVGAAHRESSMGFATSTVSGSRNSR